MSKPTVDQELLTILKMAIDFNSTIMGIVTVELAGDASAHNRTHQKKVIDEIQHHNQEYNQRLALAYQRVNEAFDAGIVKLERSKTELDELILDMVENRGLSKEVAAEHITQHYVEKEHAE